MWLYYCRLWLSQFLRRKYKKTLSQSYGVVVAGGQDQAKGKIVRLAHLGYADVNTQLWLQARMLRLYRRHWRLVSGAANRDMPVRVEMLGEYQFDPDPAS